MAQPPVQSISAGDSLLACVSSGAVLIWRTNPLSSHPIAVLPAPDSQSIISAAISPCGGVLAVLLGDGGCSNPVLLLCHPESAAPLIRLELPPSAEQDRSSLLWVPGNLAHSLLVPLEDGHFMLFKFFPGYRRLDYKRRLNCKCKFGPTKRTLIVNCGKLDKALVVMYANAIAVYSFPDGRPLIVKEDVCAQTVMKIIQTPAGHAALGLVGDYASRIASAPGKAAHLGMSSNGVQHLTPGLMWAVIGNKGCRALAPLSNFSSEKVLTYAVSGVEKCQLVLLTDAGRILFLDPFCSGGPLFEYRLPVKCIYGLESAALVTGRTLSNRSIYAVLCHRADDQYPAQPNIPQCMHIIRTNPDDHSDSDVTWGFHHCESHPAFGFESGVNYKPTTIPFSTPTINSNLSSVPLKLLIKPQPTGSMEDPSPNGILPTLSTCATLRRSSAATNSSTSFSVPLKLRLKPQPACPKEAPSSNTVCASLSTSVKLPHLLHSHASNPPGNERTRITDPIPSILMRLRRRAPKPLSNITNLGVKAGIRRPNKLHPRTGFSEKLSKSPKILLRLRLCAQQEDSNHHRRGEP